MKTSHTVEHNIKFSVQAFWNEEGGMDQTEFGGSVETLNEALHIFTVAQLQQPKEPWIIVCDVTTKVKV
jgi:hypothetical protein